MPVLRLLYRILIKARRSIIYYIEIVHVIATRFFLVMIGFQANSASALSFIVPSVVGVDIL